MWLVKVHTVGAGYLHVVKTTVLIVYGHACPIVTENYQQLKFLLPDANQYVIQEMLYACYGLQGDLKAVTLSEFL